MLLMRFICKQCRGAGMASTPADTPIFDCLGTTAEPFCKGLSRRFFCSEEEVDDEVVQAVLECTIGREVKMAHPKEAYKAVSAAHKQQVEEAKAKAQKHAAGAQRTTQQGVPQQKKKLKNKKRPRGRLR